MGSEACGSAKLIGWFSRLVGKVCLFTFKALMNPRQEFGISLQILFIIIVSPFLLFLLNMGLIVQVLQEKCESVYKHVYLCAETELNFIC